MSSDLRTICSASSGAVEQRARRGERVVAAGADAGDARLRLEHVAGAGQHQRHLGVGDDHHGFEPAQIAVGAPVLGELDRGAQQLPGILLELGFQPLEQREGVGGGAGKAADHVAFAQAAHLLGIGLDDGLADGDLAVAADHHRAALADGEDGGAVPARDFVGGHNAINPCNRRHLGTAARVCKRGRRCGESRKPLIKGAHLKG